MFSESIRPQPMLKHYPESLSTDSQTTDQLDVASDTKYTPEGYLDLEQESRAIQQALALEFDLWSSEFSDQELREMAKSKLDELNSHREEEYLERGDTNDAEYTTIDIQKISRNFLQKLVRPNWNEHFPKDESDEEKTKWQSFVSKYPSHLKEYLEELLVVDRELREQANDFDLMSQIHKIRAEKIEVMRAASKYIGAERMLKKLAPQDTMIRSRATCGNRGRNRADDKQLGNISRQQLELKRKKDAIITSEAIIDEIVHRREIQDSRDLQKGILLTEQMQNYIEYVQTSLFNGRPVLFVGNTGGAKTALAEFISKQYFGKMPEIISGHGDVNSYHMFGKTGLISGNTWTEEDLKKAMSQIINEKQYEGPLTPEINEMVRRQAIESFQMRSGPVSSFIPGPILRAMRNGVPLILDEINAIPPEFLKGLNRIMQLRPGDEYVPQEDPDHPIVVKPGFCIIATANEKHKRYKGVQDFSVEFLNRFGANIIRISYPDDNVPDGQLPKDNLRLAFAYLRNRDGSINPDIDLKKVVYFVKAAHITQKLFSGSETPTDIASTAVRDGLQNAVIAPRNIIDILENVKQGHSFDRVLTHFVFGIKDESDRRVIREILEKHYFRIGDTTGELTQMESK